MVQQVPERSPIMGERAECPPYCIDDPSSIRSVIDTANAIERTIKEIRKRRKPMDSLRSLDAVEKVVYVTVQDLNEEWAGRKWRGFAEAQEVLQRMFEKRYC